MSNGPHRVVIVGGGFAGTRVAAQLARLPVQVTLIDRVNHHLFAPLLYQVAAAELSEGQIAPALREMFRRQENVRVLLGEVDAIDAERRVVHARSADPLEIGYDTLVIAAGAADSYFGHPEWSSWALPMKTLDDAEVLRSRILGAFEMAEAAEAGPARDAWLTFAIVGAGPTGVELAGQLSVLCHRILRDEFRSIDPRTAHIVLLDAVDEVLPEFHPRLRSKARHDLVRLGVDVRTHHSVVGGDDHGIEAEGPDGHVRIPARTVIWSAGVQAVPVAQALADATGIELGRGGRIPVGDELTIAGHPEIFAIGDIASIDEVPGVAPAAIQQGVHAGKVIAARLEGAPAPAPFRYVDKGTLAVIGRQRAVADVAGARFSGVPAFVLWALVHLYYLVGWGNRFGTIGRWLWSLLARNRLEQVITVWGPPRDVAGPGTPPTSQD